MFPPVPPIAKMIATPSHARPVRPTIPPPANGWAAMAPDSRSAATRGVFLLSFPGAANPPAHFVRPDRQLFVRMLQQLPKAHFLFPRRVGIPRQLLVGQAGSRRIRAATCRSNNSPSSRTAWSPYLMRDTAPPPSAAHCRFADRLPGLQVFRQRVGRFPLLQKLLRLLYTAGYFGTIRIFRHGRSWDREFRLDSRIHPRPSNALLPLRDYEVMRSARSQLSSRKLGRNSRKLKSSTASADLNHEAECLPQLMSTAVNLDRFRGSRLREFANLREPRFVALLFAALIVAQALGFLVLGTGRPGRGLAESILVLVSFLALACAWNTFRRAQGITALFWFLFAAVLVVLLVPTVLQTYDTLFDQPIVSASTWRLLYCLYGAPILMMLFLPETYRRVRVEAEVLLDFFQVAIVVALIYSTFFFPGPADVARRCAPAQSQRQQRAKLAPLDRSRSAPALRPLLQHSLSIVPASLFLLVCAAATFIGDWIDLHHYVSAAAWFNLGWAVPNVALGSSPSLGNRPPSPNPLPSPRISSASSSPTWSW